MPFRLLNTHSERSQSYSEGRCAPQAEHSPASIGLDSVHAGQDHFLILVFTEAKDEVEGPALEKLDDVAVPPPPPPPPPPRREETAASTFQPFFSRVALCGALWKSHRSARPQRLGLGTAEIGLALRLEKFLEGSCAKLLLAFMMLRSCATGAIGVMGGAETCAAWVLGRSHEVSLVL